MELVFQIGDWVKFLSRNPERPLFIIGKIVGIYYHDPTRHLMEIVEPNGKGCCRLNTELTLLSDEEAMIGILEFNGE